jgi:hypothetical protein
VGALVGREGSRYLPNAEEICERKKWLGLLGEKATHSLSRPSLSGVGMTNDTFGLN